VDVDVSGLQDAVTARATECEQRVLEHVTATYRTNCLSLASRFLRMCDAAAARVTNDAELEQLCSFYDDSRALELDVMTDLRKMNSQVRCCTAAAKIRLVDSLCGDAAADARVVGSWTCVYDFRHGFERTAARVAQETRFVFVCCLVCFARMGFLMSVIGRCCAVVESHSIG
jgi:hypothetical protein